MKLCENSGKRVANPSQESREEVTGDGRDESQGLVDGEILQTKMSGRGNSHSHPFICQLCSIPWPTLHSWLYTFWPAGRRRGGNTLYFAFILMRYERVLHKL